MKLVPFIAENAAAALTQIQEQLGPEAVVVSVRKLPAHGIARLWNRSAQIEVLACVPESGADSDIRNSKSEVRNHFVPAGMNAYVPFADRVEPVPPPPRTPHRWKSIVWLESLGLLSEFADQLERRVTAMHGEEPPPMPIDEWHSVRDCLGTFWRPARHTMECTGHPHVFVGPPGSGKTTVLCKWMTQAVLMEERNVKVWRLDSTSANTAEFLSLHCEMLGIQAERFWRLPESAADYYFVDLPGVELRDTHALTALREQLAALPEPHVHLVLNAAYDTALLFDQLHAFAPFAPEDIIFTHLDEEPHRVKLWNFVLGKNFPISFLSAGQKIPGEFARADFSRLFPSQNPRK